MISLLNKVLEEMKNKTFFTLELENAIKEMLYKESKSFNYRLFAKTINELEEKEEIKPVISSKKNGMNPSLYRKYTKVIKEEKKVDIVELFSNYHPQMDLSYFKTRSKEYGERKTFLESLSSFLYHPDTEMLSVNERSIELFEDEKFLESLEGKKFLANTGLTIEKLMCEKAYEPFFYYHTSEMVENILIIENKDTFFSLKSLMREGINTWGDITFQMLIYGEGSKITKSIEFIQELNLPDDLTIYYFGDIDREGIAIKHRLSSRYEKDILWMVPFYLETWSRRKHLPSKKLQNWSEEAIKTFLSIFPSEERDEVYTYLQDRLYVPQEVLNRKILRRLGSSERT